MDLDGGFIAIISNDEAHYVPVVIPKEYQRDDIRITFIVEYLLDQISVHMCGTLFDLPKIDTIT